MAKVTEKERKEYAESIKPYKAMITTILEKEKRTVATFNSDKKQAPYKKLDLCEDMIHIASLYMAQNSLSLSIQEVKDNDVLNDARKIIYKAIIYLEQIVTDVIDIPYSDLIKNYDLIKETSTGKRFYIVRKLGLAIGLLEEAFGDNSKWKWSFVELKGRFITVSKNLIDMRTAVKSYFNPNDEEYEFTVLYIRFLCTQLEVSAKNYRDKYELSTRRIDDMRNGIKFLLARQKLALMIKDPKTAEEIKKKAVVWKGKMTSDQKSGASR